jgi:hypothetical protein
MIPILLSSFSAKNRQPHMRWKAYGEESPYENGYSSRSYESKSSRVCRYLGYFIVFMTGVIFAVVAIFRIWPSPYHPKLPKMTPGEDPIHHMPNTWFNGNCGDSAATAHAQNCYFSVALHAWLPQSCITDADFDDEVAMYELEAWPFTDDGGKEVSLATLKTGDFDHVWTTASWHIAHCTFVWQRLHRAFLHNLAVDSYTADYHHTTHCQEMVVSNAMGTNATKVLTKYPTCP